VASFTEILDRLHFAFSEPPQALAMWDELLVYGTALGVAKQTLKTCVSSIPLRHLKLQ